jgi:hypothetical protein
MFSQIYFEGETGRIAGGKGYAFFVFMDDSKIKKGEYEWRVG